MLKPLLTGMVANLWRRPALTPAELLALQPRRILLVRQHNQMGDMVCATPCFRAVREAWPTAISALVTAPVNRQFTGRYPFNLWAAHGYVVYVVQPRGTIGYGQVYSAKHVNAWGDYAAADVIEGTEKFVEAHDFVDDERIDLRPTEYRLLNHLIQNAGWVVPHETLLAKVWGYEYRDETHYLRLYINYLRKKIEEDPGDPKYILTERGVGYRFYDFKRQKEK